MLLDPASHAFQRLDTDSGFFLIALEDATPYLDGYKLTINIGNPSAAKFTDVTVTIKWAKKYTGNYTSGTYQAWQKTIQTKDVPLTTTLEPADWNPVEIILIPASSDQLGYLEFSMATSTVSLHTTPASP